MSEKPHKAGFVSIIGKPNVGKSTLMNVMVGERLSIITSKAQTTRHRIMGILNGDDFQIVYSDTPGIIQPKYELHQSMMRFVSASLEDADVILFVTDIYEKHDEEEIIKRLQNVEAKILLLINKIDQATEEEVKEKITYWGERIKADQIIPISALEKFNTDKVFQAILDYLPEHPAYYDKDELTDKPERFFAAEIIREKIFLNYKKEIPYSCEVVIEEFKEEETIIRMRAEIMVERKSQKGIVIGHEGKMLKKVGTQARQEMEQFFAKQVHLELYVRVQEDWRSNPKALNKFGYNDM
ncbi:GTPase Era [Adhaeribacter radiodurans]|uniref:GTPase Era n=1 Tax=Adhaeribacter radiodurans TaxID=2745197 RepID=A0A7L7L2M3_9BACT|nr:GTPase Era [Adhaeribacter radiodurans]QMU27013.1 GTPase Era [Adhaeribacter radiodurans]